MTAAFRSAVRPGRALLPYHLARVVAACGEAVFLYCALRWFVFAARRR